MPTLSRPPSRELTPTKSHLARQLSIEKTYQLADAARRKSSSEASRGDFRRLIGHSNILEMLLLDIAQSEEEALNSPPPSPKKDMARLHVVSTGAEEYEDDGAEDLESLSLVKTVTRGRG